MHYPADDQVVAKDQPNILVACLQKSKQKEAEAKRKEKAESREQGTAKRKQAQSTTAPAAKKQNTGLNRPPRPLLFRTWAPMRLDFHIACLKILPVCIRIYWKVQLIEIGCCLALPSIALAKMDGRGGIAI